MSEHPIEKRTSSGCLRSDYEWWIRRDDPMAFPFPLHRNSKCPRDTVNYEQIPDPGELACPTSEIDL